MLIDLLNSANYIMVNRDAISILGLNAAVYCSELLNIYKKASTKNKLIDEKYFKIDRKYITKQTSLSEEDQIKCDLNLVKVNIIEISESDPNVIFFDIEVYASILSSEDVKLLDNVSKKVKVTNPKGTKATQRACIINSLKDSIRCNTYEVLVALRDWIDSIMANPQNYLSVQQVSLFKDRLDDYCNGDLQLALKIIEIATIHGYRDCQWAINTYEKDKKVQSNISSFGSQNKTTILRTNEQKITSKLSEEVF